MYQWRVNRDTLSRMKRTRQVQFLRRGALDWDAFEVVDDFRWEDPDVVILDAEGEEVNRIRIGVMEERWGWHGGTVWVPDEPSPR